MNLDESKTKINLMRAFAGESQARNRYYMSGLVADKEGYEIIGKIFNYTADQEKMHAKMYYECLRECTSTNIDITAGYPVDIYDKTIDVLRAAEHNENEEAEDVYPAFADTAEEEGFKNIAALFRNIAVAEKGHCERFKKYADYIEEGKLFKSDTDEKWICTVCGFIYEGKQPPKVCPVCRYPQGYYIRYEEYMFE